MIKLNNVFNKFYLYALISIVVIEIISFLAHQNYLLNYFTFFILIGLTFILSIKKLEWGIYILLTELFIGSKGYLFFIEIFDFRLSLRIGIFIILILAWFIKIILNSDKYLFNKSFKYYYQYLILFVFIIIGIINGLAHSSFKLAFFDFNGWIYFAILPVLIAIIKDSSIIEKVINIFLACITYLSVKTILLYILFIHQFNLNLLPIYRWVRDSGVGEITKINDNFYRIFFQAHLFLVIGLILLFILIIYSKKVEILKKHNIYLLATLVLSALLISFSRSFWLGMFSALVALFILFIIIEKPKLIKVFSTFTPLILIFLTSVLFINLIALDFSGNLQNRINDSTDEPAASSRINQLVPLYEAIKYKPVLGYGFGKTVTYISEDPRIRQVSPDGTYSTYAFEWGYLDIWLKLGLFGLLAYFYLLGKIIIDCLSKLNSNIIYLWLLLSTLALIITSIFSPYLNHPLGIGLIILITVILNYLDLNENPGKQISN